MMFIRRLAILFALAAAPWGATDEPSQHLTWWIAGPLAKIRPLDPVPEAAAKTAAISAGRNEFEPFQIVLRSEAGDLAGIDVDFSDLRNSEGSVIPKKNFAVYREDFTNVTVPTSAGGAEGLWPDALIPRVDQYTHEHRNAFPLTVRRGRNQPLWVEIFIPPDASPGDYSGTATVSLNGIRSFSVPVQVTVWHFTLPSTSSLRSSFGLSGINLLKVHRGRYTNDEELHSITGLYTKAALLHRITTHGGSMQPPKFSRGGKMELDWRDYDEEVGPYLDGVAIPSGEPLYGAKATSAEVRTPSAFDNEEQQRAYWSEWTKHFQKKGWADRLFLYLWDEPKPGDYAELRKRGQVASQVDPRLRSLVTVPFTPKLEDVVQVWVPLVNCLEVKPGFPDFCGETPPLDVYSSHARPGTSLWFYQSCASHGCNIIGGPYFSGWPSYMIDASGAANRVMQWVAWKYQVEGELYYSMNEAYGQGNDPWANTRISGGNGDGTLFYPGRPDRIGGRSDIPIESIRLKLIREGMEDYEYLALLSKLKGREAAAGFAARIVKQPYSWESGADAFLNVRQELGNALDRATSNARGAK